MVRAIAPAWLGIAAGNSAREIGGILTLHLFRGGVALERAAAMRGQSVAGFVELLVSRAL